MFNEFGVYQIMKDRQEETEKKARDAWKYEGLQKETWIQKIAKKWERKTEIQAPASICCCACQC